MMKRCVKNCIDSKLFGPYVLYYLICHLVKCPPHCRHCALTQMNSVYRQICLLDKLIADCTALSWSNLINTVIDKMCVSVFHYAHLLRPHDHTSFPVLHFIFVFVVHVLYFVFTYVRLCMYATLHILYGPVFAPSCATLPCFLWSLPVAKGQTIPYYPLSCNTFCIFRNCQHQFQTNHKIICLMLWVREEVFLDS